jgi:hypothetical protein
MGSLTSWGPETLLLGPGSELPLLTAQEAAAKFVQGIVEGHILIPSDDRLWDILRNWADDPDAFIRRKIAEVARGELGMPVRS